MTNDEFFSLYSDMHKDARGFRPRDFERVAALSAEERDALLDGLQDEILVEILRDRADAEVDHRPWGEVFAEMAGI